MWSFCVICGGSGRSRRRAAFPSSCTTNSPKAEVGRDELLDLLLGSHLIIAAIVADDRHDLLGSLCPPRTPLRRMHPRQIIYHGEEVIAHIAATKIGVRDRPLL